MSNYYMSKNVPLTVRITAATANITSNGVISYVTPVRSILDIPDVKMVNGANGATLVYDANTQLYDIEPLPIGDVTGNLDYGEF